VLKQSLQREKKTDSLSAQGSRLSQIKEWLQGSGEDGKDALIVFDECHVSGACSTLPEHSEVVTCGLSLQFLSLALSPSHNIIIIQLSK